MPKHLNGLYILIILMISISCKKSPSVINPIISTSTTTTTSVSDNPFPNSKLLGELTMATNDISGVGCMNKLFFAGYGGFNNQSKRMITVVDIFDLSNNTKESHNLSIGRKFIAVAATDSKVFFAGGWDNESVMNRIDIYDIPTNTWSTAELSIGRFNIGVAIWGNKIYFAGGTMTNELATSRIDIYDASTNSWSTAEMPWAGTNISTAVIGNKIIFAIGVKGTNIPHAQVYNTATNTWSIIFQPTRKQETTLDVLYDNVYFIGYSSVNNKDMTIIDVYNISTGKWETHAINQFKTKVQMAVSNSKIAFIGGILVKDGKGSRVMDIYNSVTGLWYTQSLSTDIVDETIISYNNKVYSAGGKINDGAKEINSVFVFDLN